jgi:hypothetical protein
MTWPGDHSLTREGGITEFTVDGKCYGATPGVAVMGPNVMFQNARMYVPCIEFLYPETLHPSKNSRKHQRHSIR